MNNELKHYGVLGMKWGVRHDKDYKYTSRLTKKYGKKAEKAEARGNTEKAEQYRNYQKRSAELDRRDQQYATRVKTAGNIASRFFLGAGGRSYQRILSSLGGQNASGVTGKKIGANVLNRIGASVGTGLFSGLSAVPLTALTLANPVVGVGAQIATALIGQKFGTWSVSRIASRSYIHGKD